MRTLCAAVATLALGLASCVDASAQADNRNRDRSANDRNQSNQGNQGETRLIRGVIAGVTVEGETAIDYHSNRAVLVEMSYLTIVGSEANQGRRSDRDDANRQGDQADQKDRNAADGGDRQASSDRQRHNVYAIWVTPRTEFRRANARRGDGDRNEQNNDQKNQNATANAAANANAAADGNSSVVAFDALEVGDRVEVRYNPRRAANDSQSQSNMNRRHGRHRTYFGDAVSVTIVAEPGRNDRNRDRDADRDRDRNKQDNDRDK